jgi:hypothetical protein
MRKLDPRAVAVNAAGIADALACLRARDIGLAIGSATLTKECAGHIELMLQIVEAAEIMEQFRISRGSGAAWGGELPYLYEVWDAIADAMTARHEMMSFEASITVAIKAVTSVDLA